MKKIIIITSLLISQIILGNQSPPKSTDTSDKKIGTEVATKGPMLFMSAFRGAYSDNLSKAAGYLLMDRNDCIGILPQAIDMSPALNFPPVVYIPMETKLKILSVHMKDSKPSYIVIGPGGLKALAVDLNFNKSEEEPIDKMLEKASKYKAIIVDLEFQDFEKPKLTLTSEEKLNIKKNIIEKIKPFNAEKISETTDGISLRVSKDALMFLDCMSLEYKIGKIKERL